MSESESKPTPVTSIRELSRHIGQMVELSEKARRNGLLAEMLASLIIRMLPAPASSAVEVGRQ